MPRAGTPAWALLFCLVCRLVVSERAPLLYPDPSLSLHPLASLQQLIAEHTLQLVEPDEPVAARVVMETDSDGVTTTHSRTQAQAVTKEKIVTWPHMAGHEGACS